ncbi:MAG: hypothetical protein ACE5O2_05680 [Armatimonadota bacterium]
MEEGLEPHDFFSAEEWSAMPALFQRRWARPSQAYIKAHAADPEAPELKKEFLACLHAALKPEWIPPDLEQRMVYIKRGEGLESLWNSYFYARYALNRDAFDLRGRFSILNVLVKRRTEVEPSPGPEVRTVLEAARSSRPHVGQRIADPAPALDAFLQALWQRYARIPNWREDPGALGAGIEMFNRGLQSPPAAFTVPGRGWKGWANIWTDGARIEMALAKPDIVWRSPLAKRLSPKPVSPATQPLNPQRVRYEDTRQLLDERTMPVSDEERAYKTVLRIIYRRQSRYFISSAYFVRLPVTEEKWRLCEYHALTKYICHRAKAALYCAHIEGQLVDPFKRRRGIAGMETSLADYRAVREDFEELKYPPAAEAHHEAVSDVLEAGERAWNIAETEWDKALAESPDASEGEYAEVAVRITSMQREAGCDSPGLRRRFDNCMSDFARLLCEKYGINEGVEHDGG